ncbi:protein ACCUMULATION AND REPLICATION OF CHLOROPLASTS 3, chloroplastic isoform X2 [Actinidia eriantha]|uniref:protein ACCUMULATION AND REPLICATION OF CHLOROPLASTS 3, chloroplastic isoform X2 n=1 Tax=Actinidia eriantha TaxID=165200 RepID=UPI00258A3E2C|nr:protein ACCUMULATION AND REPLICATION OF CHLOROPLASTS 3, chloroplastic isoform X2 [Actinidia eriantha]
MELYISTSRHKISHPFSSSPKWLFKSRIFHGIKSRRKLNSNSRPLQVALRSEKVNGNSFPVNREESGNFCEGSEFVEVIGIGSRKDAVLDFCLDSPLLWPSLRFWNILIEDSAEVQLQQRFTRTDITPRVVEAPSLFQSYSKAVATAAYGSEHITVVDILKRVKSANGLVVGIMLKPFSFEGRKRQDEVKDLLEQLQEHTNFCVVVDTNVLLEKDLVTLDEALKTANSAVLMAINAISILISESQKKHLVSPQNSMKELKASEAMKILESYKEAKIGFGAGYNIKTSIMRAVYDCPFLSVGLKDLDGIVICIVASSAVMDCNNENDFLHTFRQTTECRGGIIMSTVHESNVETNLIMTTVITVGRTRHQASQESTIFSRVVEHFPFIFNLLRRHQPQSQDTQESYLSDGPSLSDTINTPDSGEMPSMIPADRTAEGYGIYSAELQMLLGNDGDEINDLRGYGNTFEQTDVEFSQTTTDFSNFYNPNTEGVHAFQRELFIRRNLGPGYHISQGTDEGANDCGATSVLDNISIYKLPVGVKPSEELKNSLFISNSIHCQEKVGEDDLKAAQANSRMSWDALTGAGFEAVSELYDSSSAALTGNYTDASKKQGVLSVRAASMLEAERESQKKWNPIVEMKYRGGLYKGRCQGGLPEGKGRLSLRDGSIYDGMWRYGKRSGLGTFYFSNGDVFQGSWRDDVMHGKGWLYFRTGDRWFVNFWKGKANGEGRFYSKLGEIFFGHFKDGWRHGHFLCINVDGERCHEIWDEGVLVSRKQLDTDAGSG